MGQDEVGLEVLPPPPGYSTSSQHEDFIMPTSFTIHKQGDSEVEFNLRGNSGSTPLSIACTYKNTEDDFEARVNLLSREDENASPLATVKYSRHSAELEFINTSPPSNITMYYRLLGDRNATHSFNLNTPQRTCFEWRNLGDGEGWKLYMSSRPEVLAAGALNMGSDKPTRFEFTDLEMVKKLDEQPVHPIVLPIHASAASPSPLPLPSTPINTSTSPMDAILGLLTLSQDGKPDLVLLNEARPKEHCDLRLNELSVSYWTRVPISNRSASTLISTFLETDNAAVGFVDKDLFLTDLVQHNPTFCSAFLVSSILYLACVGIVNDLIELYKNAQHPSKRLAHLATVSRTWQRLVEEHTFQDLRLTATDLAVFQKYVHSERRPFVKSIILRVSGGLTWPGSVDWTILPDFFSGVIMSTTAIESIHIEEWGSGFGICSNRAFSTPFTLPPSVKQLSYFHGVSQYPEMNLGAPNTELLDHVSQASDHLEHIAVSYAIGALKVCGQDLMSYHHHVKLG
ncbi:hypothetical protein ACKLNR_011927 [Fusarium oxysporum f. sp. zingiberi]